MQESIEEIARRNLELGARVFELTHALARSQAVAKLHAGTVHDLRNAFHVTLMAAEAITRSTGDEADRELATAIAMASHHGAELSRDLLSLLRDADVETANVSGAEVLGWLERLLHRYSAQGIRCVFEADDGVWPVRVARSQLEAALIHCCVNARDAMPNGGMLRVFARNLASFVPCPMLPRDDYVEFSVSDTGTGMSPDVLMRATEAFFTTKTSTGGAGLGLAMANTFASCAGGALAIDSVVGHGTTVKIVLPRESVPPETIDVDPAARMKLDKLQRSIRAPELRQALQQWRALCPEQGFPRLFAAERELVAHTDQSLLLKVESDISPPILRLVRMGSALERILGRTRIEDFELEGPIAVGTLAAAYRRTFRSRFPIYEYAGYSLEGGRPDIFERLILPVAADGYEVTHLLGLIRVSSLAKGGRRYDDES